MFWEDCFVVFKFYFGVGGMVRCRIYHHLLVSEVLLVRCLVLVMYVIIAKFV